MNIAIIIARIGSKRLKNKNIKFFFGKPVIAYSIINALNSKIFSRVIVSTESKKISNISKFYGAEVPFKRPKKFCKNNSNVNGAFFHLLDWVNKDEKKKYDFLD